MAKYLKEGKDIGGFAIEGKGKGRNTKGWGGGGGGSIVKVNNTHLQSPLAPRKRWPQGQIEH